MKSNLFHIYINDAKRIPLENISGRYRTDRINGPI